jgi:hypothetical protein
LKFSPALKRWSSAPSPANVDAPAMLALKSVPSWKVTPPSTRPYVRALNDATGVRIGSSGACCRLAVRVCVSSPR